MTSVLVINNNPEGVVGRFTPLVIEHFRAKEIHVVEAQTVQVVDALAKAIAQGDAPEVGLIVTCGSPVVLTEAQDISLHITKTTAAMLRFPDAPVVGICYGMQLLALLWGGSLDPRPEITRGPNGEKGAFCPLTRTAAPSRILPDGPFNQWCSNYIFVDYVPDPFIVTAVDSEQRAYAMEHKTEHIYGVLFHPEMLGPDVSRAVLDAIIGLLGKSRRSL